MKRKQQTTEALCKISLRRSLCLGFYCTLPRYSTIVSLLNISPNLRYKCFEGFPDMYLTFLRQLLDGSQLLKISSWSFKAPITALKDFNSQN